MFVWLRVQGFESSVNKVFQKEKDNRFTVLNKEVSSAGANLVQFRFINQLCLQIFLGGMPVLLASPKGRHFGLVSLPLE
jgi:hypothetical protein